jgi:putative Mg2+ transporter-C (MgtC) family protein
MVAGIGFIGGGVILHRADVRMVRGLTTAASIWVVAATGVAVGTGLWRAAVMAVILVLVILSLGRRVDHAIHKISSDDPEDD